MKLLARCVLLFSMMLMPVFAWAQIDRTEINGTVTDPSGAIIAGVTVTVTQEGTNQVRVIVTDSRGQFVVSSLPIGRFTVMFTHDGFKDLRVADLDLHSGDVRTVNAKLEVGAVTQIIGVEGRLRRGTTRQEQRDIRRHHSIGADFQDSLEWPQHHQPGTPGARRDRLRFRRPVDDSFRRQWNG